MPRASYHHGDLRRALVAAALAGVDRDGALPSWRALARECGVSPSAPYRHFDSAEALEYAVIAEGYRQLEAAIRKAKNAQRDPRAALEAGFRAYVRFGMTRKNLYGVMFARAPDDDTEATAAARGAYSTLVEAVAECGVKNPLPVSLVLWTGHHGLADILRLGLTAPGMSDAESLIARTWKMLDAYVDTVVRSPSTTSRSGRRRS